MNSTAIASFFDIDGTLLPPPSLEKRFLRFVQQRGQFSARNFSGCLAPLVSRLLRAACNSDWRRLPCALSAEKTYLRGVRCAAIEEWRAEFRREQPHCFPAAIAQLRWHAQAGHRVFLVSGTLQLLAEVLAEELLVRVLVQATRLESSNGVWTGAVRGVSVCGPEKARSMERLAAEYGLALDRCYAYGNSLQDCWMLERAGNPVAVNPTLPMAWLARRRGWNILRWNMQKESSPSARQLAQRALATMGERNR